LITYVICHVFSYQDTARRIARVSKEAKLEKDEEEYVASFKPQMMDIVHAWCNGCSFADICKMTEIFEGMLSGKQSFGGRIYRNDPVHSSVHISCKRDLSFTDKWIQMKLYTVAVIDWSMFIKVVQTISREIISSVGRLFSFVI